MNEEKCAQCGIPATPGAKFCEGCGAPLPVAGQPVQRPGVAEQVAVSSYQGVAIRFVAQLIDVVILGVVFWVLGFTGAGTITIDASTARVSINPFFGLLILLDVVIAFLYFTILEGHYGQTVGKMVVKIKVVKQADKSSISYLEAAVRTILRIIDLIPFLVPYLLAAILVWSSEEKQRLGDRVAQTVVVNLKD